MENVDDQVSGIISSAGMVDSSYRDKLQLVIGLVEREGGELSVLKRSIGSVDGTTQVFSERLYGQLLLLQHLRREIELLGYQKNPTDIQYLDNVENRISRLVFLKGEDAKIVFRETFNNGDEVWESWSNALLAKDGIR